MKTPTRERGERCIRLRMISKQGGSLTEAERVFVLRMFGEYEEWFGYSEARVFNETAPFGSNASREVDPRIYDYSDSGD